MNFRLIGQKSPLSQHVLYVCLTLIFDTGKGLVINYGEGPGGLQNGKIAGPNFFAPPPLKTSVKLFMPPLLKGGNFTRPPTIWLKLQATT